MGGWDLVQGLRFGVQGDKPKGCHSLPAIPRKRLIFIFTFPCFPRWEICGSRKGGKRLVLFFGDPLCPPLMGTCGGSRGGEGLGGSLWGTPQWGVKGVSHHIPSKALCPPNPCCG